MPPWMKVSPLSRVVELAYQRGRFMSAVRTSVLVDGVNRFELLLPVLVVAVPVQLSPPATNTWPVPGKTSCVLQKRSARVSLLKVRCPALKPASGSQMS